MRHRIKIAVYVLIEKDNQYLFLERKNTNWCDGMYTLPAGHIDKGETPAASAKRETKEEVDLDIKLKDLELIHVLFERDSYIDFYFKATKWSGKPKVNEPNKCGGIKWLNFQSMEDYPIIEKVNLVLSEYQKNENYTETDKLD